MKRPATRRNRELSKAVSVLIPRASLADIEAVMAVATRGHLRHLPPSIAAWQAVTSVIRHEHTDYDSLLADGYDPDAARHFTAGEIDAVLERWGSPRRIGDG